MAIPRFIISNPFRILGIPANSTERGIVASIARLSAYARVGKSSLQPLDIPSLFGSTLRNLSIIDSCSAIRWSTSLRVKYALVWFSIVTPQDAYAVDLLRNGDLLACRDLLPSSNSYSACINSAVVCFIQGNLEEGIGKVLTVVTTPSLRREFLKAVTGETDSFSESELVSLLVELLSESVPFDTIALAFNSNETATSLLNGFYLNRWSREVDNCLALIRGCSSENISTIGETVNRIKSLLARVNEISSSTDSRSVMLCDTAARAILEKSIDMYNSGLSPSGCRLVLKLIKEAASMARGNALRNRCKENYSSLLSNINSL